MALQRSFRIGRWSNGLCHIFGLVAVFFAFASRFLYRLLPSLPIRSPLLRPDALAESGLINHRVSYLLVDALDEDYLVQGVAKSAFLPGSLRSQPFGRRRRMGFRKLPHGR